MRDGLLDRLLLNRLLLDTLLLDRLLGQLLRQRLWGRHGMPLDRRHLGWTLRRETRR